MRASSISVADAPATGTNVPEASRAAAKPVRFRPCIDIHKVKASTRPFSHCYLLAAGVCLVVTAARYAFDLTSNSFLQGKVKQIVGSSLQDTAASTSGFALASLVPLDYFSRWHLLNVSCR